MTVDQTPLPENWRARFVEFTPAEKEQLRRLGRRVCAAVRAARKVTHQERAQLAVDAVALAIFRAGAAFPPSREEVVGRLAEEFQTVADESAALARERLLESLRQWQEQHGGQFRGDAWDGLEKFILDQAD